MNLVAAIVVLVLGSGLTYGQSPQNHRSAFGELRATVMESLLSKIHPGARFQWDPDLRVEIDRKLREVTFPGFTLIATSDGRFEGATGVEFGRDKEELIYNAEHLRSVPSQKLPTDLAVFETDARGVVTRLRVSALDPSDALTKIKLINVKPWAPNSWPVARTQYVSYFGNPDSFTRIEWNAAFDTNSGQFVSRLPLGIVRITKDGGEETHPLTVARKDPNTLQILDSVTKTVLEYRCSDPCVMDGNVLISEWAH
jgi:hypothetical protein